MTFTVKAEIAGTRRDLKKAERSIVPRAARNALNDTAFDVRKFIVFTMWPRSFPGRRNSRFPSVYFRVTRKARIGSLLATVGPNPVVGYRNFVDLQIKGGAKIPRGRYIAIPTRNVKLGQRGPFKSQLPKNIPKAFVADMIGRGPAIWSRGKGTKLQPGKLKLWYVLQPTAHVSARFPFFRLGYAQARRVWPRHFERELAHGLRKLRK